MVAFNPNLPNTQDPNYMGYSRGISQPEPNKSAVYAGQAAEYVGQKAKALGEKELYEGKAKEYEGKGFEYLFKGMGDLFTSGVKTADAYIKSDLDNKLYTALDSERRKWTGQLEDSPPTGIQVAGPASGLPSGVGPTGPVQPQQDVPLAINQGFGELETMVSARANNKLSPTLFYGKVDAILSQMRDRYMGHRDYIDQRASQILGVNPANAYVQSLIRDIDAASTQSRAERDKLGNRILMHMDIPGMDQLYMQWKGGAIDDGKMLNILNQNLSVKYLLEMNKMRRDEKTGAIAENRIDDEQKFSLALGQTADNFFTNISAGKFGTIKDVGDFVGKALRKEINVDSETANQLANTITAQKGAYEAAALRQATDLGFTRHNSIGMGTVKTRIAEHSAMIDTIADMIKNKEWGLAGDVIRQNKSMVADTSNRLFKDKNLGAYSRLMATAREQGGDLFVQKVIQSSIGNLQPDVANFLKEEKLKMGVQAVSPPKDPNGNPLPIKTFNDLVNNAKQAGVAVAEYNSEVIKTIGFITDKDVGDNVKMGYILGLSHENNKNFISKFAQGRWNTPDGSWKWNAKWINGREEVWAKATSPNVVSEVIRLSDTHMPELKAYYKDWVESTFSKELFPTEIQDLKKVNTVPGLSLAWDNKVKQFKVLTHDQKVGTPSGSGANLNAPMNTDSLRKYYETSVERVNKGIAGLRNASLVDEKDVDAYVFRILRANNVKLDDKNGAGMLLRGMTGPLPFAEGEDAQRGSLSDFLRDPARVVPARGQNAPAGSRTRLRGNLSDSPEMPMAIDEVPLGMSPEEYLKQLKTRK